MTPCTRRQSIVAASVGDDSECTPCPRSLSLISASVGDLGECTPSPYPYRLSVVVAASPVVSCGRWRVHPARVVWNAGGCMLLARSVAASASHRPHWLSVPALVLLVRFITVDVADAVKSWVAGVFFSFFFW